MRKRGIAWLGSTLRLMRRLFFYVSPQLHHGFRKLRAKTRFLKHRIIRTARVLRKHHANSFGRLHLHLLSKKSWYARWHGWRYHHHVHHVTVTVFVLAILIWLGAFGKSFASDITKLWDFAIGGDYSASTGAEIASSKGRLRVQNYANDANTMALYHLDEASGTNVADSSSNSNTGTASTASWASGNLNNAYSGDGSSKYISAPDSLSLSLSGTNTLEAWTKFSSSFSAGSHATRQPIIDKGSYQLFYDNETGKVTYELERTHDGNWTQQAGGTNAGSVIKNSWDLNGKNQVTDQVFSGTDLYVALGAAAGDAEVWKCSSCTTSPTWTMIGGKGVNSSWAGEIYDVADSLAVNGSTVYAGVGGASGQGEVWRWNGSSWTKIGGDAINSSWAINSYEVVRTLAVSGTTLYAGLGNSSADAEVWRCTSCDTSPTWSLVGGDGNGGTTGWSAASNTDLVTAMRLVGSNLVVGLGFNAGEGEVWSMDTGTLIWTKRGGDGSGVSPQSWGTTYELAEEITNIGNVIYVGLGSSTADAEVWSCDISATCSVTDGWTQIGGDGLNSSWNTNYESVRALVVDSSNNIYAGLGDTAGDHEVWKWNGSTWSQIGGDGLNSGFGGTTHNWVHSLAISGNTLFAGLAGTPSTIVPAEIWKTDLTTVSWSKIAGNYINKSWGYMGLRVVESMTTSGGKLYAGTGTGTAGPAQVWEFNGTAWTMIGGQGINSSWAADTYEVVYAMASYNNQLYVGLGFSVEEAEVWRWDGSSWAVVADGQGSNSSWPAGQYDVVESLTASNGKLYAGLGLSNGFDAEVWEYNGSTWTKIGGDGLNGSWSLDVVSSMNSFGGYLIAGLGDDLGENEVWAWNGSTWSKWGGGGSGSGGQSWVNTEGTKIESIAVYNGKLVVGFGVATGAAEVWECTTGCTTTTGWTKIGGDSVNSSWSDPAITTVKELVVYNGELYAGTSAASVADAAQVWRYNGSTWTQVGGANLGNGFSNSLEYIQSMTVYQGKLYAGTGDTPDSDARIYSYGNNAVLQSTSTSQDTSWHHIAATYDGATMKLYRDGTLDGSLTAAVVVPNGTQPLYVGTNQGSPSAGIGIGFFSGSIDELRISNIARSSFTTKPFSTGNETVQPATAVYTTGVASWDSFTDSETLNGGTINFRLSSDGGSTWKYWGGSSWATSTTLSQVNLASVINSHIATFPVTSFGLLWQAVLAGNGDQQVTLNSVTVTATSDSSPPDNPSVATGKDTSGGSITLTSGNWYNYTAPYFSWTPPADPPGGSGGTSGVSGYYVYFGTDNTADPFTAGAFQTAANYTAGSLASGSTYYLRIKTKDNASNVNATAAALFTYKFDSTAPATVDFINVSPVGCSTSSLFNFTWPASSDSYSGLAGYEYRLGSIGTVQSVAGLSVDAPAYQIGDNVFYVRAKDNAGNVSAYQTGIYCSTETATVIDGPTVAAGPSSLTVSWTSSKATTSFVRVLEGNTYISEQGQSSFGITHSVRVVGLEPEKGYKFKLVWSDAAGNLGESPFFDTNTSTAPNIRNFTASILSPTSSLLSWQTTELSSATIEYGIGNFGTTKTISGLATSFSQQLTGLTAGSNYQIRIAARTQDGYPYFYSVTLQTPPFPRISNLRFDYLKEAQATVQATWTTNVPSTSLIKYTAASGETKIASSAELVTDHSLIISNLLDNTIYSMVAQSTDRYGNTGISDVQKYETPFDTRPPKISNLRVEVRSNGLGFTQKAQVVISWETDEPSSSQIQYGPGIASDSYPSQSQEDTSSSTNHVVIVSELQPSKLYHLRAVSKDKAGNVGNSVDTTIITGKIQRSAIDLITESLQRSLNFLRKIPLIGR